MLGFIVQVGEREAVFGRNLGHVFRRVVRVALDFVGGDRHYGDAAAFVVASVLDEAAEDVLHERAVVAEERDQQRMRVVEVTQAVDAPGWVREAEVRGGTPQGLHP
jgi:hypothetical protein